MIIDPNRSDPELHDIHSIGLAMLCNHRLKYEMKDANRAS
jgi:hypothetical protein